MWVVEFHGPNTCEIRVRFSGEQKGNKMVLAEPEGEPRVVAYQFRYEIADAYIEQSLDEEGIEQPKMWKITFELRDLPNAELRRRARAVQRAWTTTPGYPVLDKPTEDPVEFIEGAERWMAEATGDLTEHEAAERGRSERREQFEQDKRAWIEEHGSSRLRRASKRDYKVNRLYAQERAAQEFPRFWLETSSDARWNERTDPSEAALDLEDRVRDGLEMRPGEMEVRIVWLTEPPAGMGSMAWNDLGLEWAEQEVILVQPYLGRYRLFLPVDTDLWRPTESDEEED